MPLINFLLLFISPFLFVLIYVQIEANAACGYLQKHQIGIAPNAFGLFTCRETIDREQSRSIFNEDRKYKGVIQ